MRPGQSVNIHVDTFGRDYLGTVENLPGAAGTLFSLLPPENASGNFVKVVQRLPVRIRFNRDQDPQHLLGPVCRLNLRSECAESSDFAFEMQLDSEDVSAAIAGSTMFKRILVAYDESSESKRALVAGIHLAKSLNAELRAVTVREKLPPYAGYIDAEVPGGTRLLQQQAFDYYRDLQARAQEAAQQEGVNLTTELVEGDEVQGIVECAQRNQSDLLVLGLHRHSLLFSRLWNHTTHDVSQQVTSSILGVH